MFRAVLLCVCVRVYACAYVTGVCFKGGILSKDTVEGHIASFIVLSLLFSSRVPSAAQTWQYPSTMWTQS